MTRPCHPLDVAIRKALEKIKENGPERLLAGVEVGGDPIDGPNSEFWPLSIDGKTVGHITRCVFSPRLKKNIGFANLRIENAEFGTELTVATPRGDETAIVCEAPWFPAKKKMREEFWQAASL